MRLSFVRVKDIEEYKKAYLILSTYSLDIHPNFNCDLSRVENLFNRSNQIMLFINSKSILGCLSSNGDIFNGYHEIDYQSLINNY